MKPAEFWELTLSEFDRMARGYHRRQLNRQERQTDAWRRARLLATILVNINRDPKIPAQTPQEFMWLPGDAPPVPAYVPSEEEFAAQLAALDALDPDML